MSNLLAVIPAIIPETTDQCIESILRYNSSFGLRKEDVLLVDNSQHGVLENRYDIRSYRDPEGHNLGVARSWNVGAREVLEKDLDYLLIVSASMLFGPVLHTTWLEQMERGWGSNVIEADGHSWHLIAFHRRVFEKIGIFDENFYPGYFEALDFSYRMRQVGWEGNWSRFWVNALSTGVAAHNEIVSCPAAPLLEYSRMKWGGDKGKETFVLPFGDKPLDWWPEHTIPELAKKYKLKIWW